jgi:hypothetical protein
MLQIVSGKFFTAGKCYETLHRGTYYTNYRTFQDVAITTTIGRLLPSTGLGGMGTLTYELLEKIEWVPPAAGVMTSTGGRELVDDFAAVLSFILQVTCTTNPDLLRRLTAGNEPEMNRRNDPSKYLRRVFDAQVLAQTDDASLINDFVEALIGLKRESFDAAIRAIRRYVTATHRIADDTSLAYALFIMSIESLAQTADDTAAVWSDYEESKRQRIDNALADSPVDLAERVRSAVLENEHVAMSRKFRDFSVGHISPAFFRAEAAGSLRPITRPDLVMLLRRAYDIRSGYVHRLRGVPKLLSMPFSHAETFEIEGQPTLTFQGIARLARHVITQFVQRSPKVEREEFDWHSVLPNIVRMPLASQVWIGRPEGYTGLTAAIWLQHFLGQVSALLLGTPGAALTDVTAILEKVEDLVGSTNASQRRPMLALYHLFIVLAGSKYERPQRQGLLGRYGADFADPNVEWLAVCLVTDDEFPWSVEQLEGLHASYYRERRRKSAFMLGELLEAMFTLRLAEMNRVNGNEVHAHELISYAVEAFPSHSALRALESNLGQGQISPINVRQILLPPTVDQTTKTPA